MQVFGGDKHTTVLLARLRHHAHMLTTKGSFYRTSKRDQKEVSKIVHKRRWC